MRTSNPVVRVGTAKIRVKALWLGGINNHNYNRAGKSKHWASHLKEALPRSLSFTRPSKYTTTRIQIILSFCFCFCHPSTSPSPYSKQASKHLITSHRSAARRDILSPNPSLLALRSASSRLACSDHRPPADLPCLCSSTSPPTPTPYSTVPPIPESCSCLDLLDLLTFTHSLAFPHSCDTTTFLPQPFSFLCWKGRLLPTTGPRSHDCHSV